MIRMFFFCKFLSIRVAFLTLIALMTLGCEQSNQSSENALHRFMITQSGLYHVVLEPAEDPIPLNKYHSWTLSITNPNGDPIKNATVHIAGGMPDHGHGLPSQPVVSSIQMGREYKVEGVLFNMPGRWQLQVLVNSGLGQDSAVLDLEL